MFLTAARVEARSPALETPGRNMGNPSDTESAKLSQFELDDSNQSVIRNDLEGNTDDGHSNDGRCDEQPIRVRIANESSFLVGVLGQSTIEIGVRGGDLLSQFLGRREPASCQIRFRIGFPNYCESHGESANRCSRSITSAVVRPGVRFASRR